MSDNPFEPIGTGTDDDPTAGLPPVSEADVHAAMGVNSVPDEVRTASQTPDETNQTIDATGQLGVPAEEEPSGVEHQ